MNLTHLSVRLAVIDKPDFHAHIEKGEGGEGVFTFCGKVLHSEKCYLTSAVIPAEVVCFDCRREALKQYLFLLARDFGYVLTKGNQLA